MHTGMCTTHAYLLAQDVHEHGRVVEQTRAPAHAAERQAVLGTQEAVHLPREGEHMHTLALLMLMH